jgi:hypothetical protein
MHLLHILVHDNDNNSVETGRAFLLFNLMEPLAVKKFENFEQLRCLYPEFRCVFIGDNGQGMTAVHTLQKLSFNEFLICTYTKLHVRKNCTDILHSRDCNGVLL